MVLHAVPGRTQCGRRAGVARLGGAQRVQPWSSVARRCKFRPRGLGPPAFAVRGVIFHARSGVCVLCAAMVPMLFSGGRSAAYARASRCLPKGAQRVQPWCDDDDGPDGQGQRAGCYGRRWPRFAGLQGRKPLGLQFSVWLRALSRVPPFRVTGRGSGAALSRERIAQPSEFVYLARPGTSHIF